MKKTASNTEKIVLETVWLWIEKTALSILQKLKLDEAFTYIIHQKDGVMNCLEDGNCSISNNLAENSILVIMIGRKNRLLSGSPKGADCKTIHSIIPYYYILFIQRLHPIHNLEK